MAALLARQPDGAVRAEAELFARDARGARQRPPTRDRREQRRQRGGGLIAGHAPVACHRRPATTARFRLGGLDREQSGRNEPESMVRRGVSAAVRAPRGAPKSAPDNRPESLTSFRATNSCDARQERSPCKCVRSTERGSAPERIRTSDLRFRSPRGEFLGVRWRPVLPRHAEILAADGEGSSCECGRARCPSGCPGELRSRGAAWGDGVERCETDSHGTSG